MNAPRLSVLLIGVLALAGCSKSDNPASKRLASNKPEDLILGKWQIVQLNSRIDWRFASGALSRPPEWVRIRADEFEVVPADNKRGEQRLNYEYTAGTLTLRYLPGAGGKNRPPAFKVSVTADELVLTDAKGHAQSFKRVQTPTAHVEVSKTAVYSDACAAELRKELEKAGVFDIQLDAKAHTASFKIDDADEPVAAYAAFKAAGMYGQFTIDGKPPLFAPYAGAGGTYIGPKPLDVTLTMHACCPACQAEISRILNGATVTFDGPGPIKKVRIQGDIDFTKAQSSLVQAGFSLNK